MRRPVRASFAMSGAGSLGTFVSAAVRELLVQIRAHNRAIVEGAPAEDDRYLHPRWGFIVIDSVGGSSAGALCACQLVKALFQPSYAGEGGEIYEPGTMTGDWLHGGDFGTLSTEGNRPTSFGAVEAPGWSILSGANLARVAHGALTARGTEPEVGPESEQWPGNPLDPTGVVGVGITLTDLLGYHEAAEFLPERVLGHPSFGRGPRTGSHATNRAWGDVRDLGGREHAEVRKLFLACDQRGVDDVERFLDRTKRSGRARVVKSGDEAWARLSALSAASASLPFALGPIALTDSVARTEAVARRLYMDGGTMNNKPIAPALKLARWHDGVRMERHRAGTGEEFEPRDIERELVYERVCFFVDAFPDRSSDDWRSPHPDDVISGLRTQRLTPAATQARNQRIDAALDAPHNALDVFFESIMTSLRAQDIRGIARINRRVWERSRFVEQRCGQIRASDSPFSVDDMHRAQAWAAVLQCAAARESVEGSVRTLAERVHEMDRVSGLYGRREVTMVPVFTPENLVAVLAGEGLYALGGLLALDARYHDIEVGRIVARAVAASLRDPDSEAPKEQLDPASVDALPDDTSVLLERIRVFAEALIDRTIRRSPVIRFFAKLPLRIDPILRLAKERLDREALGMPSDDDPSR